MSNTLNKLANPVWASVMLLLFIGTLSSSLPARQAANLSVRETIAYE